LTFTKSSHTLSLYTSEGKPLSSKDIGEPMADMAITNDGRHVIVGTAKNFVMFYSMLNLDLVVKLKFTSSLHSLTLLNTTPKSAVDVLVAADDGISFIHSNGVLSNIAASPSLSASTPAIPSTSLISSPQKL